MVLEKVKPFGYCKGVNFAIQSLHKIIKQFPSKQIHLISLITHNRKTNKELLKNKNVFFHEGKDRKKIIENILKKTKNRKNLLFILPAHGTDPQAIKFIKENKCQYYDFTCGYIKFMINKIKNALAENYEVYFYGKNNHPETQCIKDTFGKKLNVFWQKKDLKSNNHKKFVVCQTTTNYQDFLQIKKWFRNAVFEDTICGFCKQKQKQACNLKNSKNSIIVISDAKSNNGIVLFKLLKTNNKYVYLLPPNLTKPIKIKKTNKIYIFTSSSVSKQQANIVLEKQFKSLA